MLAIVIIIIKYIRKYTLLLLLLLLMLKGKFVELEPEMTILGLKLQKKGTRKKRMKDPASYLPISASTGFCSQIFMKLNLLPLSTCLGSQCLLTN